MILKLNQLFLLWLVACLLVACATGESDVEGVSQPTEAPAAAAPSMTPRVEVPVAQKAAGSPTLTPLLETATLLPVGAPALPSLTATPPTSPTPTMEPSPANTPWPTATSGPTPTPVPGWHTVEAGNTLLHIAINYDMSLEELMELNKLGDDTRIDVGDILTVWKPIPKELPLSDLIHDSEVVYSPVYSGWDTEKFLKEQDGFLADYSEKTQDGEEQSAAEIIDELALKYHIGPRVLLGTMEYLSGWVTEKEPESPDAFGLPDPARPKLWQQTSWAAETMLNGYYAQLEGRRDWVILSNGSVARLAAGTNPGSAAITNLFAKVIKPVSDVPEILEKKLFQETYKGLFGEVDGGAVMPPDGKQPYFAMPWPDGQRWSFSGGPHGGYVDEYSAWAALDFAPPLKDGCNVSPLPIYALGPGYVVSSDRGETWIDMDEDRDIHTGWSLLYMHLATAGRIEKGEQVEAGDMLGFPSCEGGYSTASHLHIARMYDGQWMPADGPVPFQIGDWIAEARLNNVYRGYLTNQTTDYRLESSFAREPDKNIFPGDQPIPATITPAP